MANIVEIDLRSCEGYLAAIRAFENWPSIVEYDSWLQDRSWIASEAPMEDALELITEHTPWLLPAIDRYMLARLKREVGSVE